MIRYFALFAVVLFLFSSCSEKEQLADQGLISYKIAYIDESVDNPLVNLMPGKMVVKFRNHNTRTRIDGPMGLFCFEYLSDYKRGVNYTLLRIIDKKYSCEADSGGFSYGYEGMDDIKIVQTNEIKMIAGFECKKVIIYCDAFKNEPVDLYYTNQIRINNPNGNNPYKEIDGVLMDFQMRLNHINMHITADKVIYDNLTNAEFEKPEDYKAVTVNELDDILKPLFYPASGCTKIPTNR